MAASVAAEEYHAIANKYCADPHEYGEYLTEATNLEECASMTRDSGNCGDHFSFVCNDFCWQDEGCTKKSCAGTTETTPKGSNTPGVPLCVCFHKGKACEKPHDHDDWTVYKFGSTTTTTTVAKASNEADASRRFCTAPSLIWLFIATHFLLISIF